MATGGGPETAAPVISVVIPAYNAAATLSAQLEALTRQSIDEPWEVIVADNGSTDDTARVAGDWSGRLPLRVVDASARRGPAAARNIGVASAKAPLLAFCDADDEVADDWLPQVLGALQDDEFVAIGVRLRAAYSSRARPEFLVYAAYESVYLPGLIACGAGHMAMRTGVYRAIGGFDESMLTAEDHDLCYRIELEGIALMPHPEAVVTVHRRDRLIDVFRQQYHWGANDAALRHKYALVREVLERALADGRLARADPGAVSVTTPDAPVPRAARLRAALRSPREFADLVARQWSSTSIRLVEMVAFRLGRLAAPADTQRPQVAASLAEAYVAARSAHFDGRPDAPDPSTTGPRE